MNQAVTGIDYYRAEFARMQDRLPGGARSAAVREAARAHFLARGFPTLREEDWKYTSVAPIERRAFRTAEAPGAGGVRVQALLFAGLDCHRLVFVDGYCARSLGALDGLPAGAAVDTLGAALAEDDGDLAERLAVDERTSSFVAMNAAFTADGARIRLPAGMTVEQPLHLLFIASAEAAGLAQYPRVLIELGAGAQLTVIEHYTGPEEAGTFTNTVTAVTLDEGAVLEHYKIQEETEQAYHVGSFDAALAAGSRLVQHSISIGARLARHDLRVRLAGREAGVVLNGLYLARGRQHVDHHTRVDHLVPHTTSEEYYRGVINDYGRGVFNGKVVVHPQAYKSAARQSNKNLLLARHAEVDTKPELEIYADDVQCSHGATVGQLDAAALFYLRSRGIDEHTARSLLVYAFADDVIARIGLQPVRARLEARVLGRMPDAERLREFV